MSVACVGCVAFSSAVLWCSCAHGRTSSARPSGLVWSLANAAGVGVVVGNAAGVGGIIAGICVASVAAAGTCWGVGLFAIPNTIATTAERIPTIPTPIAQRARRWVCRCRASLCLRSISLRIRISRSDAVTLSYAGSVESRISKKNSHNPGFLSERHEASLAWCLNIFQKLDRSAITLLSRRGELQDMACALEKPNRC